MTQEIKLNAAKLTEIAFTLLGDCAKKEVQFAKQFGLTTAEFHCLRFLNSGEIINNKDLAARLSLSPSRLTRIINGLVEKKYVNRNLDPSNRRSLHVSLTKKGETTINKLKEAYVSIHEQILSDIDPSLHKHLITGMTHLLSALRRWVNK
jgi:DNA-binding MarR family transcriptional regulator